MTEFNPDEWTIDQFSGKPLQIGIENWVRATHIPTGVSAVSSSERSQLRNRDKAIEMVQAKLKEISDGYPSDSTPAD